MKEPLLLALCTATATAGGDEEDKTENDASKDCFTKPIRTRTKQEIGPNMVLDTELYEGIVSQTIIEPKVTLNSNLNRFKTRRDKRETKETVTNVLLLLTSRCH